MTKPPLALKAGLFVLSTALTITPFFVSAAPQKSTTAAPGTLQSVAVTPAQKTYAKAYDGCIDKYLQQKIPRSQFHSFVRRCLAAKGITKAVDMPRPPPLKPSQSAK
jgi:hypothetical protein